MSLPKKNSIFASTLKKKYFKSGTKSKLSNIVYKKGIFYNKYNNNIYIIYNIYIIINAANIEHILYVSHYIRHC